MSATGAFSQQFIRGSSSRMCAGRRNLQVAQGLSNAHNPILVTPCRVPASVALRLTAPAVLTPGWMSVQHRKHVLAKSTQSGSDESTEGAADVRKDAPVGTSQGKSLEVAAAAATSIFLGVANRVLYKMALVPLRKYPFFLAQLTTFGYVLVYFFILWARTRSGVVTQEMLAIPKGRFVAMGALEALGLATGMAAATVLPGTMITILSQSFLAWQLVLSYLLLKRRFSTQQVLGCFLVILGVMTAIMSSGPVPSGASLESSGLLWPAVMVLSAAFPACSSIIKEGVFASAAKNLKSRSLDIFVVNSFGSGFQALFVFLLLPALTRIGLQMPFSELPSYVRDGAACMLNMGALNQQCSGAPFLPILYIVANLAFNISLLHLLKKSSAVTTSLCVSTSVPLTVAAFTLPLPFLGKPQVLGWAFTLGATILVAGLFVYNSASLTSKPSSLKKLE